MCRENPSWGAPRVHGELVKLGIDIGETSVSKYMVRWHQPPSQTWRTFLENHLQQLVSIDFFTVPTLGFQVLYVFLVLAHDRRRIVHCNVAAHPTAEWSGQQLREAFPFDQLPTADWPLQQFRESIPSDHSYQFLTHDRDAIFSSELDEELKRSFGLRVLRTPVRAPKANAFCERLFGTLRRECLDFMILLNERHLRMTLRSWVTHYNRGRPHST